MAKFFVTATVLLFLGVPTCIITGQTISSIDYAAPEPPKAGEAALHILTTNVLELKLINSKESDPAPVTQWDFIKNGQFIAPSATSFAVEADNNNLPVSAVYFKRRPFYGPLTPRDLRIDNSLYLVLSSPVSDNQIVEVKNPNGTLWPSSMVFKAKVDPLRYSPAIHVNQEGYMPGYPKKAMVGYYAGDLGELNVPAAAGFRLVDARTGQQVYQGALVLRRDIGYTYSPAPYQKVYEADFTSFTTPGEYQLVVPTLGASLSFLIHDGIAISFARAYALGIYHQRCGTATTLPYTRFVHGTCHSGLVQVPADAGSFPFTWTTISNYAIQTNPDNPAQSAPPLLNPAAQLYPYSNQGPFDVSGGHHDAGDYSKYTINSASLIHYLMFAVDSLPGVATLDNLGIPESGDGISDVMQEAKWEADFLAKLQDQDGGFYFLVYPQNREYESNVTPDRGDPQVVWPKTTSVTAASVAALAQIASSPGFRTAFPDAAGLYLQKAQLGWQFLLNAISKYGKSGAYQKITHYGDNFADNDELAWAACQIFLATGDSSAHQLLLSWFDPSNPATWRWGWWRMSECYGHTIRSYAFAVQSGRVSSASQLDPDFLTKCRIQIGASADDTLRWSTNNAYGASFPDATKAVKAAGWFFSTDQAFDMAVAYQLNPRPDYLKAMVANMNYEGGCNPVNVCYVTGLGWKRTRNIVSQWALNDERALPPSGIPVGNIQQQFYNLWNYNTDFEALCYPSDTASIAPYPFYDRWGDFWNVSTEMVTLNSARSIGLLAFLAAQTPYKTQPWKSPAAQINVPASAHVGLPVAITLRSPNGLDLSTARFIWEGSGQAPAFGRTFTFVPKTTGPQWVESEAQLADGRRVFARGTFNAN